MKNTDDEIINDLVVGGVIGASLGALLTKGKGPGFILGAIAGAALFASIKASKDAKRTNVPLVIEENNIIYRLRKDGTRVIVKKLKSTDTEIPKKFKLK